MIAYIFIFLLIVFSVAASYADDKRCSDEAILLRQEIDILEAKILLLERKAAAKEGKEQKTRETM